MQDWICCTIHVDAAHRLSMAQVCQTIWRWGTQEPKLESYPPRKSRIPIGRFPSCSSDFGVRRWQSINAIAAKVRAMPHKMLTSVETHSDVVMIYWNWNNRNYSLIFDVWFFFILVCQGMIFFGWLATCRENDVLENPDNKYTLGSWFFVLQNPHIWLVRQSQSRMQHGIHQLLNIYLT